MKKFPSLRFAALPGLLVAFQGCATTFGDQTESSTGTVTTTVLDDRLPLALEELWRGCQDDFVILSDDTSVSLTGSCSAPPTTLSVEAQTLWWGLAFGGALPIDIPSPLFDERSDFSGFSWPLQNCSVLADTEVYFNALGFESLDASWVRHDGGPALKIRLANPPSTWGYAPVYRSTIATATCPSPINQGIVRGVLDSTGVNDAYEYVRFDDLDVELFLEFGVSDGRLTASLDVEPEITGMDLGIDFSALPSQAESSLAGLEDFVNDELGAFLADQLQDLPDAVLAQLETAVPDGDEVCSVKLENGSLKIVSGHATGFNPCVTFVSTTVPVNTPSTHPPFP